MLRANPDRPMSSGTRDGFKNIFRSEAMGGLYLDVENNFSIDRSRTSNNRFSNRHGYSQPGATESIRPYNPNQTFDSRTSSKGSIVYIRPDPNTTQQELSRNGSILSGSERFKRFQTTSITDESLIHQIGPLRISTQASLSPPKHEFSGYPRKETAIITQPRLSNQTNMMRNSQEVKKGVLDLRVGKVSEILQRDAALPIPRKAKPVLSKDIHHQDRTITD